MNTPSNRVFADVADVCPQVGRVVALRYTAPALAKKAGGGFSSPNAQAAMAAIEPQFLRPFTFVPQFMAARMGGRKPCRFMAPPVRRSANPFGLPPMFSSVVGSCSQAQLEPTMTQSAIALQLGHIAIRQHGDLYSLNDLHRASGGEAKHRPNYFLGLEQTKDLTAEIEKAGIPAISAKPKVGTFACKELVIAYAAWISAAFHLKVIRVFLAAVQPALPNACITPEQAGELAALIAERFPDGRDRPYAWGRFNNHFRIARYRELPAARFDEACAYIRTMQPKALPAPSLIDARQYETLNELLARLARQLAEPNGYTVITFMPLYEEICRQLGHSPRYVERLPELLADPGFEVSDELLSQLQLAVHQRLMQKLAAAKEGMEMLGTAIRRIKGPRRGGQRLLLEGGQ